MSWALGVLPVILLLAGFPIFLVLLTSVTVALVFLMNVPLAALHQNLFGSINAFALLAGRKLLTKDEHRAVLAQLGEDLDHQRLVSVSLDLELVFGVPAHHATAIDGATAGGNAVGVAVCRPPGFRVQEFMRRGHRLLHGLLSGEITLNS